MTVERIPEMALTLEDEAAICALLEAAFGDDYHGQSFFKQRAHLRLVHRDNGRIVSHIALTCRAIRIGEQRLTICGIGEVATGVAHRGRGIAGALMSEALAAARDTTAEFAVLFGEAPLYAGHGFRPAPNLMRFVAIHDARTLDVREDTDPGLMVLPLRERVWDDTALIDLLGPMF